MIYEYDFTVTVEIQSDEDKEQKELIKKFKHELYTRYAGDEVSRIVDIKMQ